MNEPMCFGQVGRRAGTVSGRAVGGGGVCAEAAPGPLSPPRERVAPEERRGGHAALL